VFLFLFLFVLLVDLLLKYVYAVFTDILGLYAGLSTIDMSGMDIQARKSLLSKYIVVLKKYCYKK
jgi:hypothetical protein